MERIDTLVLPAEPKAVRPPRLDRSHSPWVMAARLGRYLMGGMDDETREEYATLILRAVSETDGDEYEPDPNSIAASFRRDTKSPAHFMQAGDITYVTSMKGFRASRNGLHEWAWRSSRNHYVKIFAFDMPTAVGALAVTGDMDAVRRILSKDRCRTAGMETGFYDDAERRWAFEENRAANRRYARTHTAGVFEDKLHCDDAHRAAAVSSLLSRRFRHIELDDSVDLNEFQRLDREFDELCDRGWLPAIGSDNALRFRLCGRHHAIGVYSPTARAIAIDPRAPRSGAHEMAHAYDFEHGQLSARPTFAPILDRQRALLRFLDLSENRYDYYATPTEVFARAYELHLLDTGRASSMTSASVAALCEADESAAPLAKNLPAINEYFDSLGL